MYHVPSGYPNTNNPIESFDKLIKLVYTNYKKTKIFELLEGLRDRLVFKRSNFPKEFRYYRTPKTEMQKETKLISENAIYKENDNSF